MTNQKPNMLIHHRRSPVRLLTFLLPFLGPLAAGLLTACAASEPAQTRAAAPTREEGQAVFAPPGASGGAPTRLADAGWTIVLRAYTGSDARAQAMSTLQGISSRVSLPTMRVQDRGRGSAIVVGSFSAPSDPAAQRELQRVRELELDGQRPFATAFLAPPVDTNDTGGAPQFHLSRATQEFGTAARYTLQIGVYESANPAEARRAAEQAAVELRRGGEPAFYYHGPSRSMVTIGAFTARDAGLDSPIPSAVLEEFRRRHPYNLFNGRRLEQRTAGASRTTPQPSFLVEIPER
ncbi:MAG: hypothetical protein KF684_10815 [Phycisphaeraceae bacterium]|nr:hypothetical protein [Phycisphaeraceae bacterium]